MTPVEARAYIAQCRTSLLAPHRIDHVDTSTGRRIWLDRMTDADALFVADGFRHMEIEAASHRTRKDN